MKLNKLFIAGGLAVALALPALANADALSTINNTKIVSTVKITSGDHKGDCVAALGLPGTYTNPCSTGTTPALIVDQLCKNSPGGKCTAEIYMDKTCAAADKVAEVTLDTAANSITVNSIDNPAYQFPVKGMALTINTTTKANECTPTAVK